MSAKLIDIKINPTRTDLRVFALLWAGFFVLLGVIAFGTETFLRNAGFITLGLFLVSLAFNNDYPRRAQLLGLLIPGVLLAIWGFERLARHSGSAFFSSTAKQGWWVFTGDRAAWTVMFIVAGIGVLGMVAMLASRPLATRLYRGWMFAALPIGWVVSHLILAVVFYLVITPIGLVMRLAGRDPMQRRLEPSAATYWIPHTQERDPARYFRQF